jgi:hydrogenase expression/formation protein HypC
MCLGIPGKVIELSQNEPPLRMGRVDFDGIVKQINLTFVPEAEVGDYVVVHVGFAISTVDEEAAKSTFQYLKQLEQLELSAAN